MLSGIGNIKTSIQLTHALALKSYDIVINIWVCGYKTEKESCIQIVRTLYTPTNKEALVPQFIEYAPIRTIVCSETPVYNPNELPQYNYVDMESYAVENVCEYLRIPRLILKVPVDKIGAETRNFDTQKAQQQLRENIDMELLMKKISSYLSSLPKKYDSSLYQEHFRWTETERHILEYEIQKFVTLSDEDFHTFFQKHAGENKKDFLKKLKDYTQSISL